MRDGAEAFAVIAVVGGLLLSAWIARATGADFTVVLTACGKTLFPLIVAAGLVYFGLLRASYAVAIALVFIYPMWWPVLDNIAVNQGQTVLVSWDEVSLPWWSSTWLKWLSELALIGAVGYWLSTARW